MRSLLLGCVAIVSFLAACGTVASVGTKPPTVAEMFERDWQASTTYGPFESKDTTHWEWKGKKGTMTSETVRGNDLTHNYGTAVLSGRVVKTWFNDQESILYDAAANTYYRRTYSNPMEYIRARNREIHKHWLDDETGKKDAAKAQVAPITFHGQPAWQATWFDSKETNPDNAYKFVLVVDQKDGLIWQFRQFTGRGHVVVTDNNQRHIKPLPPETFRFVPPPGSHAGTYGTPLPIEVHIPGH